MTTFVRVWWRPCARPSLVAGFLFLKRTVATPQTSSSGPGARRNLPDCSCGILAV